MNKNSKPGDVWSDEEGWVTPHRKAVLESSALLSAELGRRVIDFFHSRGPFADWYASLQPETRALLRENLSAQLAADLDELTDNIKSSDA